jgi:hypothetical protein
MDIYLPDTEKAEWSKNGSEPGVNVIIKNIFGENNVK